jgi:5-methylcytosine-specific restriction endonuclease McrA
MKINPQQRVVQSLLNGRDKINLNPGYQRNPVWQEAKKQLLLDSILRGYDLPKFYFHEVENGKYEYSVIDGQQRLRSLFDFIDGKFPLGKMSNDLPKGDLSGKRFSELDTLTKDQITSFELTVANVRDAERVEIAELFKRLQDGVQLSPAEKRNAVISQLGDYIRNTTKKYPVFSNTTQDNNRFMLDEFAASALCLELEGGATEITSPVLLKMYENYSKFDTSTKKIKKFEKILNFMSSVFDRPSPELKIKWGFVDFYLLISVLVERYKINGKENDFFSAYINFETERRSVDDWILFSSSSSPWEKDLFEYYESFQREGNRKAAIEKRHQVYIKRFMKDIDDLVPIDAKRKFNNNERIVIWRRAKETCQICSKKISLDEMHADHIDPHSKGGLTLLSNAQCLCSKCNLSKSNN